MELNVSLIPLSDNVCHVTNIGCMLDRELKDIVSLFRGANRMALTPSKCELRLKSMLTACLPGSLTGSYVTIWWVIIVTEWRVLWTLING